MGRVWIAEHLTLETNVVVKFMAKEIAETADGAARFAREASVAAAVKSPHVVQVFDHGVTPDGDAYIVMELLEGHDLAAHLSKNGAMDPRDVAALVAQVAKALGKAHQVGVIHRDIKPDNIFLCDADGGELFVKLLDFGIAKRDQYLVKGTATTTGAVVGTPYYMSPEQIVGDKEIDARTDIWSLGVVAFEAMTGKRPFEGTTVGAITLAIHTGTRRITDHLPNAPRALDEWFAKACARDPKTRFSTPREAAQALLAAAGEHSGSSPLLVRAPMMSLVSDGSDPSLVANAGDPAADGRSPTHLSSAFPVPARPSRSRPALVIGVVAAAAVAIAAMLLLPGLLRSSETPSTSLPPPSASVALPAPAAPSGSAPALETTAPIVAHPDTPVTAATTSASAARPGGVVPSRSGTAATSHPATRPTTTGKPTKPGRTRDDDDIK